MALIWFQFCVTPTLCLADGSGRETSVSNCLIRTIREFEAAKEGDVQPVALPESIDPISINKHQAKDDFEVGVQVYHAEFGSSAIENLRKIANSVAAGELRQDEASAAIARLKEIRAPLKRLRFLFRATASDHKDPKVLNELTIAVGKLRDVIKRNDTKNAAAQANRVLASLKDKKLNAIEKAIQKFKPSTRSEFDRWMRHTLKQTEKILAKGSGTPDRFHTARKNLQAILAVAQSELIQDPDNKSLQEIADFLLSQTELMGDEIGEHEVASIANGLRYNKDKVEFPAALVQGAVQFVSRIKD